MRSRLRKLGFTGLVWGAVVLALELGARSLSLLVDLPGIDQDPLLGFFGFQTFFEPVPGAEDRVRTRPGVHEFMVPQSFPRSEAPGMLRAVCLGGSVTASAYPLFVETMLNGRHREPPGTPPMAPSGARVVNCGAHGMGTTRLLFVLREVLDYDPTVIVVSTGHNESLEQNFYRPLLVRDRRVLRFQSALHRSHFARLVRWCLRALHALHAGERAGTEGVSPFRADMNRDPFPKDEVVLQDLVRGGGRPLGEAADNYWRNLVAMVRLARQRDVPMVLLELTVRPDLTDGQQPPGWPSARWPRFGFNQLTARRNPPVEALVWLAEGMNRLEDGEAEAALAAFEEAGAIAPGSARAVQWQARALLALGRESEATRRFRQARLLHRYGIDTTVRNVLQRGVCRVTGVPFIEMSDTFARAAEELGDPLQRDLWLDHVHPSDAGYEHMAERVARVLSDGGDWDRPGPEEPRDPGEGSPGSWEARLQRLVDACAATRERVDEARVGQWLADPDPMVREAVADLLGGPTVPGGERLARERWAHEDHPLVLAALVRTLAARAPGSSVDLLREGLTHPDESVRVASVRAIGDAGISEAAGDVQRLLATPGSALVREEAALAISRLRWQPARAAIVRTVLAAADSSVNGHAPGPGLLCAALQACARLGATEVLSPVIDLLEHPDPRVLRAALSTVATLLDLEESPDPRAPWRLRFAEQHLPGLLHHPWPTVSIAAMGAAAGLGGDVGRDALLSEYVIPADWNREAYHAALRRVLTAPDPLLSIVRDPGDPRRSTAAWLLGSFPSPRVRAELRRTLPEGADVVERTWWLVPLARAGDPEALDELRALVAAPPPQQPPPKVLRYAVETLGLRGGPADVELLTRVVRERGYDWEAVDEAFVALRRLGGGQWLEPALAECASGTLHRQLLIIRAALEVATMEEVRRAIPGRGGSVGPRGGRPGGPRP